MADNQQKDIYGQTVTAGTAEIVRAKDAFLSFSGGGRTEQGGFLVQGVNMQYQRPIQQFKEVSSGTIYNFALPAQGVLSIDRIVGSKKLKDLIGNEALIGTDTATLIARTEGGSQPLSYTMSGLAVASVGSTINANSYMIQENVQCRFNSLQ